MVSQNIEISVQHELDRIHRADKVSSDVKQKSKVLTQVCQRMNSDMKDLEQRIENLELNNSKKMLIITGLNSQHVDRKEMIPFLGCFFLENLGLDLNIDDYFTLGSTVPQPIVIVLQSIQQKKEVLKVKKHLKHFEGGRKVYVNDYLPPVVQDKRKREREVSSAAVALLGEDAVTYTRSGLTIQGKPYRKMVLPPTPSEIINIDPSLLKKLFSKPTTKGDEIQCEGSIFTGYTEAVSNHQQIRDLYVKLKLLVPEAKHIVCAYWVPHQEEYYALDYHDDGEPTAGRILMDFLKVNNLQNRCIFVARRYGGSKIGTERFQCYLDAANTAVQKGSNNELLQIQQEVAHPDPRKVKSTKRHEVTQQELLSVQPNASQLPNHLNTATQPSNQPNLRNYRGRFPYRGYGTQKSYRGVNSNDSIRGARHSTQNYDPVPSYRFAKPWSASY